MDTIEEMPLFEEFILMIEIKGTKWIDMELGAIIDVSCTPHQRSQPRQTLKPIKGQSIHARHRAFVNFRVPGSIKNGCWIVMGAGGEANGNLWATPTCLLTAVDDTVQILVTNGGSKLLRGKVLRRKIEASPYEEQVVDCGKDDKILETLANIEPDWYNNPDDTFDPNLDPGLSEDQRNELLNILCKHKRLFAKKKGLTHLVEHYINTEGAKPISCTPSRGSPIQRIQILELVQKMEDEDIVKPSNSPWCSRVVLAAKPNGGVRFCVDYRAINKVTIKDTYPLPVMEDLIGHLDGATYFSSIDLESGFWQIGVASVDRPKTAFITPDGVWQFKRLPFGLQASPPNFQR